MGMKRSFPSRRGSRIYNIIKKGPEKYEIINTCISWKQVKQICVHKFVMPDPLYALN